MDVNVIAIMVEQLAVLHVSKTTVSTAVHTASSYFFLFLELSFAANVFRLASSVFKFLISVSLFLSELIKSSSSALS